MGGIVNLHVKKQYAAALMSSLTLMLSPKAELYIDEAVK
jgi:hypothetical protein